MGRFINPNGYTLRPTGQWEPGAGYLLGLTALIGWRRKRRQYEFTLDPEAPLTYSPSVGVYIQPDRHGITDMASIPEQLEAFLARSRYLPSSLLHDGACREHCLYYATTYDGPYSACPVTSEYTHRLFRDCVLAEGASRITAALMYWAVSRWGPDWLPGEPGE